MLLNTISAIFQLIFNELIEFQSVDRHVAPLGTHYLDSEPTSFYSFSLRLRAYQRSNKYYFTKSLVWPDLGSIPQSTALLGNHANHYTTDVVKRHTCILCIKIWDTRPFQFCFSLILVFLTWYWWWFPWHSPELLCCCLMPIQQFFSYIMLRTG